MRHTVLEASSAAGECTFPEGDGRRRRMYTVTASLSLLSGRWTAQILLA